LTKTRQASPPARQSVRLSISGFCGQRTTTDTTPHGAPRKNRGRDKEKAPDDAGASLPVQSQDFLSLPFLRPDVAPLLALFGSTARCRPLEDGEERVILIGWSTIVRYGFLCRFSRRQVLAATEDGASTASLSVTFGR